jgi:hypothetical protein
MSISAYPSLTSAQKIFKDLVWDLGINAAIVGLDSAVPFLAIPVISRVKKILIHGVTDWVFNYIVLFVDVTAIKLVNSAHQATYEAESLRLKVVLHNSGIDSPEFKEARDAAKIALSRFTRFST